MGHDTAHEPASGQGASHVRANQGSVGRQRLSLCFAASVSLHLGLAPLIGSGSTSAGAGDDTLSGPQRQSAQPALAVVFMHRHAAARGATSPEPATLAASETTTPAASDQVTVIADRPRAEVADTSTIEAPISIPAPHYFKAAQLDRRPRVLSEVQPEFPATDFVSVSGSVVLRLLLDESGGVDRVVVERSELPSSFQESAAAAFSKASFAPGEIDNFAVKSEMRVEVTFDSGA